MKVRLSDIARELNISVSTVSRVLNGKASISEETRKNVLETAREMGYHFTPLRSIKESPQVVGVIIPDILCDYYTQIVQAVSKRFAEKGFGVLTASTDFDQKKAIACIKKFAAFQVDCILNISGDSEELSPSFLAALKRSGIPALLITPNYMPSIDFDCLYIDERRGNAMAVEHLLHRGYRRLAFIGDTNTKKSQSIFIKTLKTFNAQIYPDYIRLGAERLELGGYLRMKELLGLKELPDAVYASYDQIAIGAIHAIEEAGLRVPLDIAVISLDNIAKAEYIAGGMTTIAAPYEDIAAIVVRVLLHRMETPLAQPQQIAIKPKLLIRSTT